MRAAAISALLAALGCSQALEGEVVTTPVADWSFVADASEVAFETAGGRRFRWVSAGPLVHERDLYLHVSTIFTRGDDALDEVRAEGALTLRANGGLYALRATELTAREIDAVLPTLARENLKVEATGLRWETAPERYPGTQVRQWFFRLEPAGSCPPRGTSGRRGRVNPFTAACDS